LATEIALTIAFQQKHSMIWYRIIGRKVSPHVTLAIPGFGK
jgi:hypothetical protein